MDLPLMRRSIPRRATMATAPAPRRHTTRPSDIAGRKPRNRFGHRVVLVHLIEFETRSIFRVGGTQFAKSDFGVRKNVGELVEYPRPIWILARALARIPTDQYIINIQTNFLCFC